jgi:hypothetical protein
MQNQNNNKMGKTKQEHFHFGFALHGVKLIYYGKSKMSKFRVAKVKWAKTSVAKKKFPFV